MSAEIYVIGAVVVLGYGCLCRMCYVRGFLAGFDKGTSLIQQHWDAEKIRHSQFTKSIANETARSATLIANIRALLVNDDDTGIH
jgi:hypothetical protein